MKQYRFHADGYRQLTVFTSAVVEGEGFIRLRDRLGAVAMEKRYAGPLAQPAFGMLNPDEDYTLELENLNAHFIYLCECAGQLERGVSYLEIAGDELEPYDRARMAAAYDQPFRNQYHFSAFKNWINDPNGLCRHNGLYHLFYQMNPNGLRWDLMHWGHAVSKDLLHWTHLPVVLYPQPEFYLAGANTANPGQIKQYSLWCKGLCDSFSGSTDAILGGAYTGSAVADEDRIRLYFTRSIGPLKKGSRTSEKQALAYIHDDVHAVDEQIILDKRPEGNQESDPTFRDPKVVNIAGQEYMLIATTVDGVCSVMMYRRVTDARWEYQGVIMRDDLPCKTFECVNYIQSPEDPWRGAIVCALQAPRDPYGRTCLSACYVGSFTDPRHFVPETRTFYDFGTSGYAYQFMDLPDRTVSFGWICSPYEEFPFEGSSANGCMTIPRENVIRDGKMYSVPAREMKQLDGETVFQGKGENFEAEVEDNCYHLDLSFRQNTDFRLVFADDGHRHIGLAYDSGRLRILNGPKDGLSVANLFLDVADIKKLCVYVDRAAIEVFVNNGEQMACKDYFIRTPKHICSAQFRRPGAVSGAAITMVRPIWGA